MNRRNFFRRLGLFLALPAIIRIPGLLMPVKALAKTPTFDVKVGTMVWGAFGADFSDIKWLDHMPQIEPEGYGFVPYSRIEFVTDNIDILRNDPVKWQADELRAAFKDLGFA